MTPTTGPSWPAPCCCCCGYQAAGTPGRDIQTYGPRGGYVQLDGQRIEIRAKVHAARVLIASAAGELVALHAFIKKTQKTPLSELAIARKRLKELKA